MVILWLPFHETAKVASKEAAPFYNPTSKAEGLHVLANTCYCSSLVILVAVK